MQWDAVAAIRPRSLLSRAELQLDQRPQQPAPPDDRWAIMRQSDYRGVSWDADVRLWKASITQFDRQEDLGWFEREKDAAIRHDRVARFLQYDECDLNFPEIHASPLDPKRVRQELRLQPSRAPTSRYDGVFRASDLRHWHAEIYLSKSSRWLGLWPTERLAAHAVDRAARYYLGAGVNLNLPYPAGCPEPANAEALQREAERLSKREGEGRFPSNWNPPWSK